MEKSPGLFTVIHNRVWKKLVTANRWLVEGGVYTRVILSTAKDDTDKNVRLEHA
jgi:hypothetical protein